MDQIRHRDNRFINRTFFSVVLICVLVFSILLIPSIRGTFSRWLYMVAPSFWEWGDTTFAEIRTFNALVVDKRKIIAENEGLRADLLRMETLVLDRNLLAERIVALEELLSRKGSDNRISAHLLWKPGRALYDVFVVDAGASKGVAKGDRVVYAGSGVVGEVIEVYPTSAKVKLYSSPGEARKVLVGEQEIPAIALGRGMGNFETRVPRGSLLVAGQHVFLPPFISGEEKLILGVIGVVEEDPEEPFDRILFRVPFNVQEMRFVEIVRLGGGESL